jgi:uncharacterized repeat protein (TIGR01451 family)
MELDNPSWLQAWQLDPAYAANANALTNCSGGGRGGYTFSANDRDALTIAPDNTLWGGNNRRERGGLGGRPVPNDPSTRIFFGGGGGAGDGNDSAAGQGGNGGGLIFVLAGCIQGSGQVIADGNAGGWSGENAISDGAGGGGGGGSVVIFAGSVSGLAIRARGGEGGWQPFRSAIPSNGAYGPGGGGGGGFIALNTTGFSALSVDGGRGGQTTATALSEFPKNGATARALGKVTTSIASLAMCDGFVGGKVFEDLNQNGSWDSGEPPIVGAPVVLTLSNSQTVTVQTGPDGSYFYMVPPGSTVVNVDESAFPFGATCTTGNDPQNLSVSAGVLSNASVIGFYFPPMADMAITKTDAPDPVYVGDQITYTIVVTNNGPAQANNVIVTDYLPSQVQFVSASVPCVPSGSTVVCSLGSMAPGTSTTLTIVVTALSEGVAINNAEVTADEVDSNTSNNVTGPVTTQVDPAADLSVTASYLPSPATNGQPATITVVASNSGPSDASNVVVSVTLDPSLSIQSVSSGCTPSGNVVTCTFPTLAAGESTTVTIDVLPTSAGLQQVDGAVSADEYDPNILNNNTMISLQVDPAADLSVQKTASANPAAINCDLTYEIVITNNGPDDATSVTLVDALPRGVTFVTASSGCGENSGIVTCDLGTLLAGESTTVTMTVVPIALGPIFNNASVSAYQADPVPGNNLAVNAVIVEPDCNSNCIADSTDLTSGTSQDCNANSIPDECDIASGTSQDC